MTRLVAVLAGVVAVLSFARPARAENLANDIRIGSRKAFGQKLQISRKFARRAEIERTN